MPGLEHKQGPGRKRAKQAARLGAVIEAPALPGAASALSLFGLQTTAQGSDYPYLLFTERERTGSEKCSNLPKVTELDSGRPGEQAKAGVIRS